MTEINDGQLAGLIAAQQYLQRVWQDPDGRGVLMRVARDSGASPEAQIAADEAKRVMDLVDARLKPIEEARRADTEAAVKAQEDRAAALVTEREGEARRVFGLTDKGIEAVRALQKARGIADPRDAAELLVARGAPELAAPSPEPFLQPQTEAQKAREKLKHSDPSKWANLEIREGLQAIQRAAERGAA